MDVRGVGTVLPVTRFLTAEANSEAMCLVAGASLAAYPESASQERPFGTEGVLDHTIQKQPGNRW